MEQHQQGVVIVEDGEHVVYLYHVARPVEDIVVHAILIDGEVYEVDDYVRAHCDGGGGYDALFVKLYKPQTEEQYRYTELKNVGEVIEEERPAEYFGSCYGCVESKSRKSADGPKHEQIAKVFVT